MTAAARKTSAPAVRPRAARRWFIGLDFDNTVARYDKVMHAEAVRRGLIPADAPAGKRTIRDRIRRGPGGELEWQRFQAAVYGPLMSRAELPEGIADFLRECRRRRIPVRIVSHKKERYELDATGTNFREVALDWMSENGLFGRSGLGLSRADVHFEPTRTGKIRRILELGCTHFVDDLEETFLEPSFPAEVEKLLYDPHGDVSPPRGIATFRRWEDIARHLFDAAR